MRIAIATDWFPPRRGGIESQLFQLATALGNRGHEVDVVTSTPGATRGESFGVRVLPTVFLLGSQVAISPAILGELRRTLREGYDVIHAHVSVVSPVGYAAAAVTRALDLPVVVTFHSVLRHKRLLLRAIDALAGLSTSAVTWTAVSTMVAEQVRTSLPGSEVGVLPNGIDVGFWRSGSAQPTTAADQRVEFVSTMRLHRKKRPRQLMTAFAWAAKRAGRPARLRIIGDGPEAERLRRDIRPLGLDRDQSRVDLLGWLTADEIRRVYADSHAFVLASERESFGIAALEAAAAGLPVIAMDSAGCREFLDESSGFLCRDDAALAQSLARFARAPVRAPNVRVSTPVERYDWRAVVARHEETYAAAIARSAAPTAVGAP